MSTIPNEAIEAVAQALHERWCHRNHGYVPDHEDDARAALTAALPHIEAAIREHERERIATGLSYLRELAHGKPVLLAAIDAIARGADQ